MFGGLGGQQSPIMHDSATAIWEISPATITVATYNAILLYFIYTLQPPILNKCNCMKYFKRVVNGRHHKTMWLLARTVYYHRPGVAIPRDLTNQVIPTEMNYNCQFSLISIANSSSWIYEDDYLLWTGVMYCHQSCSWACRSSQLSSEHGDFNNGDSKHWCN